MDEKKRLITILSIMGGIAFLLVCGMVYQMFTLGVSPVEGAESLNVKIGQAEGELARLNKIIQKELPESKARLESLNMSSEMASQLMPEEMKSEIALKYINTKAGEAMVDLMAVEPVVSRVNRVSRGRSKSAAAPYEEHLFKLKLVGDYDQISLFVNYMENFEFINESGESEYKLIAVSDIEIASKEDGLKEGARHEANMSIAMYSFNAPTSGRKGAR